MTEQYVIVEIGIDYAFDEGHEYGYVTIEETFGPFPSDVEAEKWAQVKFKRFGNWKIRKLNNV